MTTYWMRDIHKQLREAHNLVSAVMADLSDVGGHVPPKWGIDYENIVAATDRAKRDLDRALIEFSAGFFNVTIDRGES